MQHLMSLSRSWAAALPRRPLLYAAGSAAMAAGFYYYLKHRYSSEPAYTNINEEPKKDCADSKLMEPGLRCDVGEGRVISTLHEANRILNSKYNQMQEMITHNKARFLNATDSNEYGPCRWEDKVLKFIPLLLHGYVLGAEAAAGGAPCSEDGSS